MSVGLVIRPACPEDWPVIADFNLCLCRETEHRELDRATVERGVRAVLGDRSKGRYLVACDGDVVIGQMMHTREWSDWRNGDLWWIQSVYVHPDHRRRGVFRRLYQELQKQACEAPDVVGLRLYVEHSNSRAMESYRSLGMAPAGYYVMEEIFG